MKEDLEEILESIDMESYLDMEGITYKNTFGSSGEQLNVKTCPVCGGSNNKVYLNTESGLGNCFHGDCEAKFNKYSFIKAHTELTEFRDIIAHLKQAAREMGWRPKRLQAVAVDLDKADLTMPDSLALPIGTKNLAYLKQRGINGDVAAYFNLRFSLNGKFWYKDSYKVTRSQDYSNRILIPIFNIEGELVSFQGRDITDKSEKKYLFPPGYSSTGKYLYNAQNALGYERLIMNEGAFDVFATKIAMDEEVDTRDVGVIGTFGKHLSYGNNECKDQIGELLKLKHKGLKEVIFMWDSEHAALDAACKAGVMVQGLGLHVRIAILPPGKDPNEVPAYVVRDTYKNSLPLTKANIVKIKMGMIR
tara:strand:- start:5450 stop:6535 length:1086 start_codon:yes stop_codon:yes gene_type:complete